jgi:hypothetical protein
MRVFRGKFYNPDDVITIGYKRYNDHIRSAYYGGHVDVYSSKADKAYYYDINSLYPYSMLKDLPVGKPTITYHESYDELKPFFGFG